MLNDLEKPTANDTLKQIQFVSCDDLEANYIVQSRSSNATVYSLTISVDDTISCTCLGYKHRKTCWHTNMMKDTINNSISCELCSKPMLLHNNDDEEYYDHHNNHVIEASLPKNNHHVMNNKMYHEDCLVKLGDDKV